jgi:hypothetical protein
MAGDYMAAGRWFPSGGLSPRRIHVANLPVLKLVFLDDYLMSFVSRTPDAVSNDAITLRELRDNPILVARHPVRPQPDELTDFELLPSHSYLACSPGTDLSGFLARSKRPKIATRAIDPALFAAASDS